MKQGDFYKYLKTGTPYQLVDHSDTELTFQMVTEFGVAMKANPVVIKTDDFETNYRHNMINCNKLMGENYYV